MKTPLVYLALVCLLNIVQADQGLDLEEEDTLDIAEDQQQAERALAILRKATRQLSASELELLDTFLTFSCESPIDLFPKKRDVPRAKRDCSCGSKCSCKGNCKCKCSGLWGAKCKNKFMAAFDGGARV